MTAVIRAIAFANGQHCPHEGQWLRSFDHDAFDGRGHGVFTSDIDKAMRFASKTSALMFWNTPSSVRPLRPDGKLNKPLTALTVEIEEIL